LYLQDGEDSVFTLSRDTDVLKPGDEVEVVGFPGTIGKKFLLRESSYRRVGTGTEPPPVRLGGSHSVDTELAGLLTTAQGTLLNIVNKEGETRLLVQTPDSAFEASLLVKAFQTTAPDFEIGSKLAVTGVYEVQSDDYGKPRSFILRLRSWRDVAV